MCEAGTFPAQVDARDEAAELLEEPEVVELRRAAAVARIEGEAERPAMMQRRSFATRLLKLYGRDAMRRPCRSYYRNADSGAPKLI